MTEKEVARIGLDKLTSLTSELKSKFRRFVTVLRKLYASINHQTVEDAEESFTKKLADNNATASARSFSKGDKIPRILDFIAAIKIFRELSGHVEKIAHRERHQHQEILDDANRAADDVRNTLTKHYDREAIMDLFKLSEDEQTAHIALDMSDRAANKKQKIQSIPVMQLAHQISSAINDAIDAGRVPRGIERLIGEYIMVRIGADGKIILGLLIVEGCKENPSLAKFISVRKFTKVFANHRASRRSTKNEQIREKVEGVMWEFRDYIWGLGQVSREGPDRNFEPLPDIRHTMMRKVPANDELASGYFGLRLGVYDDAVGALAHRIFFRTITQKDDIDTRNETVREMLGAVYGSVEECLEILNEKNIHILDDLGIIIDYLSADDFLSSETRKNNKNKGIFPGIPIA